MSSVWCIVFETNWYNVSCMLFLQIPEYQGMEWIGRRLLEVDIPELSVWTFEAYDKSNKKLTMVKFMNAAFIFWFHNVKHFPCLT
jgi:hypothetical protein